jgi:hypothetical protein
LEQFLFRDPEFYGGAFSKTSQKEVEEGRFLSSPEGRFQARESIRGGCRWAKEPSFDVVRMGRVER